jgi:hypothetical protein
MLGFIWCGVMSGVLADFSWFLALPSVVHEFWVVFSVFGV